MVAALLQNVEITWKYRVVYCKLTTRYVRYFKVIYELRLMVAINQGVQPPAGG